VLADLVNMLPDRQAPSAITNSATGAAEQRANAGYRVHRRRKEQGSLPVDDTSPYPAIRQSNKKQPTIKRTNAKEKGKDQTKPDKTINGTMQ